MKKFVAYQRNVFEIHVISTVVFFAGKRGFRNFRKSIPAFKQLGVLFDYDIYLLVDLLSLKKR